MFLAESEARSSLLPYGNTELTVPPIRLMMAFAPKMMTRPMMAQNMCCIPVERFSSLSASRMKLTAPYTNKRNAKMTRSAVMGSIMFATTFPMNASITSITVIIPDPL